MKSFFGIIVLVLSVGLSIAQKQDSTVKAEGKIMNSSTKEPVVANLSYMSLPYANKVGVLSGSSYSFALHDNEKYSITVIATGFQIYKATLDPASGNAEKKIVLDVELVPEAVKQEEPVHQVGKVIPLNSVIFAKESSAISANAHSQLNEIANMLHTNPNMIIQIEGHTDKDTNKDAAKLNMKLSEERVRAVKDYLISKGVTKSKVKTKAFGGTKPLYTGNDSKQRSLNRRVEARILEN